MKTKITLGTFAIFLALIISGYSDVIANATGSPGGMSSSLGNSGNSCGQGGCHGGGHTTLSGIIKTDSIPAVGYTPGVTYKIGVTGMSGSGTKFGFELASENSSNASVGTFATTDARTQILSSGHATHTSSGNTGLSGSFGWVVNWTAPSAGTGSVTFSTAVLVANNNGTNSGDNTIKFSTTVNEVSTTNLLDITNENTKLYPNPVENYLNIYSQVKLNHLTIINVEGKKVLDATISQVDRVDLSFLKKGIYFITIKNESTHFTKKIIKA